MIDLDSLRPMKAVTGQLPADEAGWAFEIKWDGVRVLSGIGEGKVRLRSSNGNDITGRYPELQALAEALEGHSVILDGEVVAFDDQGRPSFGRLQQRMHLANAAEVRRRAETMPITYVVFDLLQLDGNDLISLPYLERRRLLTELVPDDGCWTVPAHREDDGATLLAAVAERGLEGIVAKKVDSPYVPGKRSTSWVKVKARLRQEFVIGGWQPGERGREGKLGSLLVGVHEDGRLRYSGKVGTGFTMRELTRLGDLLAPLETDSSPFDTPVPRPIERVATWVRPELVAEVEFGEWTEEGILRHPSYMGLRDDKNPTDVVREG
ncbi:MAG: bifunctional non-ous end joining protein LigD [Acidimicrobiaceae bacterium]